MAHIYKRGKTWTVRISKREKVWNAEKNNYDSILKQKQKGGFKTKAEAKAYGIKMESDTLQGIDITQNPVFIDYMREWYHLYKEPTAAPATKTKYRYELRIIDSYFGKTKIKSIDRLKYQNFINTLAKKYAPISIMHINSDIRACVRYATEDGLISSNFTMNVSLHGNKDKELKVEYLNIQEIKRLVAATINSLSIYFPSRYMVLTAIYTGMRLGEIGGLTWNDLDFKNNILDINKAWNADTQDFGPTKNPNSVRKVQVNSMLMDKLKELKQNKFKNSKRNLVFDTGIDKPPSSGAVNEVLRTLLKEANINKPLHFHSLRHVHVAFLLNNQIDISVISKRLGHKDIATTLKFYAYLIDELKESEDKKIISDLDNLTEK